MATLYTVNLSLSKSQMNTIRQALLVRLAEIRKAAQNAAQRGNAQEASRLNLSAQEVSALAARFQLTS